MSFIYVVALEISRVGDFYIPPRYYSMLNVTSSQSPFIAFGRVDRDSFSMTATIPVYVNENEDRRLGSLKICPADLALATGDQFTFPIGETNSITLRIIQTARTEGKLRRGARLPLPEQAIVGHRGSGANEYTSAYLENSIPSYKAALRAGANVVEIDVQLTRDGAVVVNHNLEVESKRDDCMSNVRINQISVKDFKKSGLCTPFETERPTFREVLKALGKNAILDIHMKFATSENTIPYLDRTVYVDKVLQEMEAHGRQRHAFFCTFDPLLAVTIGLRQRKYPVLLLAAVQVEEPISLLVNTVRTVAPLLKWAHVSGFVFLSQNLVAAPGLVEECVNLDFAVMSWGADNLNEKGLETQLKVGVTGFVTDNIQLTRDLIRKIVGGECT
jgi:glycerophosphoryl diester phosphodiesterase